MSGPTDPTEAHFDKGTWGFDGTVWRKLPMVWGYSALWDEDLGGTAADVFYSAQTAAIPATEVRVLQAVSVRNTTRSCGPVVIYMTRPSGALVACGYVASLNTNIPLLVTGTFALGAGDVLWVYVAATQVNDVIQAGVVGYKMAIAL